MRSDSNDAVSPWIRWPGRARLSLLLWGAGALIGLGAAGIALFTAKGTATNSVPPEYIATVNQRPLFVSDYIYQLQTELNVSPEQATSEQRRRVLDEMIREELFVQRGLELDEPEIDPDVRNALVAAVQAQVTVEATSQLPTESELTAFYQQHLDRYSSIGYLTLADLVPVTATPGAPVGDSLARAATALRDGQPLALVETQFHLKESGQVSGEQVYFAAKLHLGDRLFAIASALTSGQVSDAAPGDDGRLHLLYMLSNNPPRPRNFTLARNEVYNDYRLELQRRITDSEFKYLRDKADIRLNPAYRP